MRSVNSDQTAVQASDLFSNKSPAEIISAIEALPKVRDIYDQTTGDTCRAAMKTALWQGWSRSDHDRLIGAAAKAFGCSRGVAWEEYGDIYMSTRFDAPMPAWVAEVNKSLTIIGGELFWITPSEEPGKKHKLTAAGYSAVANHFRNKHVDVYHPYVGIVKRMRIDKAWLMSLHRWEGR